MVKNQEMRENVESAQQTLLDLHKMLIDLARADYEIQRQPVQNIGAWVNLLFQDPFFRWLHPFSQLITSIDELLELEMPISEKDAMAVRAEIENLISDFPTTPAEFRTQYLGMMQREPSIVMIHSKLKQSIQILPKPDHNKMDDLLQVRKQWSHANQLKYMKKNSKLPN
jgi:hypothetical protein